MFQYRNMYESALNSSDNEKNCISWWKCLWILGAELNLSKVFAELHKCKTTSQIIHVTMFVDSAVFNVFYVMWVIIEIKEMNRKSQNDVLQFPH